MSTNRDGGGGGAGRGKPDALTTVVVRQRMQYLCVVQDGWQRFKGDWLEIIPS